jgi:hypothetical protein
MNENNTQNKKQVIDNQNTTSNNRNSAVDALNTSLNDFVSLKNLNADEAFKGLKTLLDKKILSENKKIDEKNLNNVEKLYTWTQGEMGELKNNLVLLHKHLCDKFEEIDKKQDYLYNLTKNLTECFTTHINTFGSNTVNTGQNPVPSTSIEGRLKSLEQKITKKEPTEIIQGNYLLDERNNKRIFAFDVKNCCISLKEISSEESRKDETLKKELVLFSQISQGPITGFEIEKSIKDFDMDRFMKSKVRNLRKSFNPNKKACIDMLDYCLLMKWNTKQVQFISSSNPYKLACLGKNFFIYKNEKFIYVKNDKSSSGNYFTKNNGGNHYKKINNYQNQNNNKNKNNKNNNKNNQNINYNQNKNQNNNNNQNRNNNQNQNNYNKNNFNKNNYNKNNYNKNNQNKQNGNNNSNNNNQNRNNNNNNQNDNKNQGNNNRNNTNQNNSVKKLFRNPLNIKAPNSGQNFC